MIIKSLTLQCFLIRCLTIRSLTMIQSLTPKSRFFELFIENKNLIKQGLYLLEICQNAARSVELATDRRGHDRPSQTMSSHTCVISSAALYITLEGWYGGPSQAQWSVEGLRFKTLELLEYGYWDYFSEIHDEPAGRTVIDTTDRHKLRNPTLGQTSPSSFSSCTTLPPTDRHKHDGPS